METKLQTPSALLLELRIDEPTWQKAKQHYYYYYLQLLAYIVLIDWDDNTLVKLLEEQHLLSILLISVRSVTATDEDLLDCSGTTKLLDDEELPSTAAA